MLKFEKYKLGQLREEGKMDETGYMTKEFVSAVCSRLIKCSELFSSVVSDSSDRFRSSGQN